MKVFCPIAAPGVESARGGAFMPKTPNVCDFEEAEISVPSLLTDGSQRGTKFDPPLTDARLSDENRH